tara:strand:+ start:1140 stop:1553 length:414 start_codon:yes stop_codon:yes gene_type:complete
MINIKPLLERIEIIPRKKIVDSRGWFLKAITGLEQGLPAITGEIYTVYSENGASRGGHYHKAATEWFTLLNGSTRLQLKDTQTNELLTIEIDSEKPVTIVVPPYIAHRFDTNDNNSFLLLAYTDVIYHPTDTIELIF